MSIMIVGLSLEPDGPLARDPAISKLFVEYQFLNIGYGELETPESLSKPRPGEIAVFNFKKSKYIYPKHAKFHLCVCVCVCMCVCVCVYCLHEHVVGDIHVSLSFAAHVCLQYSPWMLSRGLCWQPC